MVNELKMREEVWVNKENIMMKNLSFIKILKFIIKRILKIGA